MYQSISAKFFLLVALSFSLKNVNSSISSTSSTSSTTSTTSTTISSQAPHFLPIATFCTGPSDCGFGAVCLMVNSSSGHCACPVGRLWGKKEGDKGDQQNAHFPFVAHCRPMNCTTDRDCWTWPNSVCDRLNSSTCICGPHYEYSSEHTACNLSAGYIVFIVFCCFFAVLLLCCLLASCVALCCCLLVQPAMVCHGEPLKDGPSKTKLQNVEGGKRDIQGKGPAVYPKCPVEQKTFKRSNMNSETPDFKNGKSGGPQVLKLDLSNSLRPSSPNDNLTQQLSEKNGVFFLNA